MKRSLNKILMACGLILLPLACRTPQHPSGSEAKALGSHVGDLKGVTAINGILASRLMGERFDLMRSVFSNFSFTEISGLLGGFDGVGIKNRFANGAPNAVNMLLWSTVFTNFANQVTDVLCLDDASPGGFVQTSADYGFVFNGQAALLLKDCGGDGTADILTSRPKELWELLLQLDAPEAEFQAWSTWIKSPEFARSYSSPKEKLVAAITAALMNPYFLLER
jgi:hypothetical protein